MKTSTFVTGWMKKTNNLFIELVTIFPIFSTLLCLILAPRCWKWSFKNFIYLRKSYLKFILFLPLQLKSNWKLMDSTFASNCIFSRRYSIWLEIWNCARYSNNAYGMQILFISERHTLTLYAIKNGIHYPPVTNET